MAQGDREKDRARALESSSFVVPGNLSFAESESARLVKEIKAIEGSIPGKVHPAARARTRYTLERTVARLQLLRGWITDERNHLRAGVVSGEPLDPNDPGSLLKRALFLLRDWAPARARIGDDEWAVVNAIERFVMRK
jgi:hypothetical protein